MDIKIEALQARRGTRRRADDEAIEEERVYLPPPRPRSGASQALIWSAGYMVPFSPPLPSGRNVECCIAVRDEDGVMRKCGVTLKHVQGAAHAGYLTVILFNVTAF